MEQDKQQKKMAGHCDLGMCGSIACARIRATVARDVERHYSYKNFMDAEAREHAALMHQSECTADCGFQDVCRRLEVAVWNRDLSELEYAIDNGRGNRPERMDIRDAGTDDHEAGSLAMGAGGICSDYHNECDSAWDGVEDTRLVLWAGADDLVVRGTNLDYKVEIKINEEANAMVDRIMRTEQGIMIKKQLKDSFEDFLIYGYEKTRSKELIEAYKKLRRD